MLGNDEAALGGKLHLRIIWEDPRTRSNYVAFKAQNGFKDPVPYFQGNSRFVFLFSRRPAG